MAYVKCRHCENVVPDESGVCLRCGESLEDADRSALVNITFDRTSDLAGHMSPCVCMIDGLEFARCLPGEIKTVAVMIGSHLLTFQADDSNNIFSPITMVPLYKTMVFKEDLAIEFGAQILGNSGTYVIKGLH